MTDTLGPLPEKSYLGDDASYGYDACDMRAYAAAEVAKARADEREKCARMVETQDTNGDYVKGWFDMLAEKIRRA